MPVTAARDRFLAALAAKPLVMGILNVTPDSFSDGGDFADPEQALAQARRMAEQGADLIDIGGESTRPGATPVDGATERARILPVIRAITTELDLPVSVDTYKASTARAAIDAGASIVNDVWGLQRDPEMAGAVAETGAALVIMHNRDTPDPATDILTEITGFLDHSLALADAAGISRDRILIDPGIGFGKTRGQNVAILNALDRLHPAGLPVLLGLSRKRLIGDLTGHAEPKDRIAGTLAANLLGLDRGARVIRVHDVAPHVDALKIRAALGAAA